MAGVKTPKIDDNKKPVIFLSHSHKDADLANVLESQFNAVFGKKAVIFEASSIPNNIPSGQNFFDVIRKRINNMNLILFLLTPNSLNSLWVWFEMGAAWNRYDKKDIWLVPLNLGVTNAELPPIFKH